MRKTMLLKNYTSDVLVSRTIARIEEVLIKAGATGIMKDFENGRVQALCFRLPNPAQEGKEIAVRLPTNEAAIYKTLSSVVRRPRQGTEKRLIEQAGKTAWKLMQDWVEVQMSLILMKQAEPLQVFLPYIWDGKQTFFENLKGTGFRSLPLPRKEQT